MRSNAKVVLIVTDGLGFCYKTQSAIADEVLKDNSIKESVQKQARATLEKYPALGVDFEHLVNSALFPIGAECVPEQMDSQTAVQFLECLGEVHSEVQSSYIGTQITAAIRRIAKQHNYVPWIAGGDASAQFRNDHLTIPTYAAGKYVGFEDTVPVVSGNSETGHQQIGSLAMIPQTSLSITQAIESGDFFENQALCETIQYAKGGGHNINISFLLSGTRGDDGLVHSNWKHLEATAKLVFEKSKIPPAQVRILAILDGRDSPSKSSINAEDGIGDYIAKLQKLLQQYDAESSLAWVIGRNSGMDRDYQEHNAIQLHDMLVNHAGDAVEGFGELVAKIKKCHAEDGLTDSEIPPLIVTHNGKARCIEVGDAFINLNFRSDRQKSSTAVLLGDKSFLKKQTTARNREWSFSWEQGDLNLRYCCITEYDPAFSNLPNVRIAFPVEPLKQSFLTAYSKIMKPRKYLLVGESIKSAHMGYFLRGCREMPFDPAVEELKIFPSFGAADGVHNDSQVYRKPTMQMPKIAYFISDAIVHNADTDLIVCNLAAPDMVGHTLPKSVAAAIEAYQHTENAVLQIANSAIANDWHVIWTSDHGNIENHSPTHTANAVLTTIAAPNGRLRFGNEPNFRMRLFDISYAAACLLGIKDEIEKHITDRSSHGSPRLPFRL